MSNGSRNLAQQVHYGLRWVALSAVVILAAGLSLATLLALFGALPWPELVAVYGGTPVENAGMWAQIAVTLFAITLLYIVPSTAKVLKLEDAHRDFHITMQDVARAYQASHAGDRAGAFSLSAEFDSVRERMEYLRDHPDLRGLEPAVMEVAAQMSHESRELAQVYAHDKIERARMFLKQRQEEIDTFAERMSMAKQTVSEIRRWTQQVNVEEAVQASQLERLEKDLLELLPGLGFDIDDDLEPMDPPLILDQRSTAAGNDQNVVPMAAKSEATPAE